MSMNLADAIQERVRDLPLERQQEVLEFVDNLKRNGSPRAILRAMSERPHLTSEDVGALEESIAAGRPPIEWKPVFDE